MQNTSLKVKRLVVRPARIAGVRVSVPNFSARCGREKLEEKQLDSFLKPAAAI